MRKYILLLITLLIMSGIFYFSDQAGDVSSVQSAVIMKATGLTNEETFDRVKDGTQVKGDNLTYDLFSLLVRKSAHITIYLILTLSVLYTLKAFGIGRQVYLYGACTSILYAMTDEFHQTFVFGRTGTLKDVLVDGIGIVLALVLVRHFENKKSEIT